MKTQLWLTAPDRDLLRVALDVWRVALLPSTNGYANTARQEAGAFTRRRIDEMLARLVEPGSAEGATATSSKPAPDATTIKPA